MNRKIIFSLILFIGVFFVFGVEVKAADEYSCTYYKYNGGDESGNIVYRDDKELTIVNYNQADLGVYFNGIKIFGNQIASGPLRGGEVASSKNENITFAADTLVVSRVANKIDFHDDVINFGYCPKYVGFYIVYFPFDTAYIYFHIAGSSIPAHTPPAANGVWLSVMNSGEKLISGTDNKSDQNENYYGLYISDAAIKEQNPDFVSKTKGIVLEYSGIIGTPVENTCEGILGQEFINWLVDYIFNPLKIISPILLLIFTTLDFAKTVFGEDQEALKKAQSNFIKRTIAVVLLFLLAYILDLVFTIVTNGRIDVCIK